MRHESQDKLIKISMRLKQYPDDPNKTLIHVAYVNQRLAETYEKAKTISVKDKLNDWACEDFGLALECAFDLATLRTLIIGRYSKIFDLPESKVHSAAWERYWIQLHINKELNSYGK